MSTTIIDGTAVETVTAIAIPVAALRELATAAVAAGKDDTLPTLTCVRLEWEAAWTGHASRITAAATDRYRLAVVEHTFPNGEGVSADGAALVPAKELAAYVKGLPKGTVRGGALSRDTVVMVPGDGEVTFTCDTADVSVSRTIKTLDADYPKYRTLIPEGDRLAPVGGISCNPVFLADVAKMPARSKGDPVEVVFSGENRPMLWSGEGVATSWQYLLMPVRKAR